MRRTYDVLNILLTAKVLIKGDDKKYTYDPFVLEGKVDAAMSALQAKLLSETKEMVEARERILSKQRVLQEEVDQLLRYSRLVRRNKALAQQKGEKPKRRLQGNFILVKYFPNPADRIITNSPRIGLSSLR